MIKKLLFIIIKKTARLLFGAANMLMRVVKEGNTSALIRKGSGRRNLYRTSEGHLFWLDNISVVDSSIIKSGYFEKESSQIVKKLIKPGYVIIDVGANIGYYSVIFAKLTGATGRVFAFEPTKLFYDALSNNLHENNVKNCVIYNLGLSNVKQRKTIQISNSSATLHEPNIKNVVAKENINLVTLNTFAKKEKITRVDFIKVDIDGHEPHFMEGAWETLDIWEPIILLEVSNLHYSIAGVNAWSFYDKLIKHGYNIYSEKSRMLYKNKEEFMKECGNFTHSANIIIAKRKLLLTA